MIGYQVNTRTTIRDEISTRKNEMFSIYTMLIIDGYTNTPF